MNSVTNKELDAFWGVELSLDDWAEARDRQTAAYDQDDLMEVAYENDNAILAALAANDFAAVGQIFAIARANTIARRVSIELTGKSA